MTPWLRARRTIMWTTAGPRMMAVTPPSTPCRSSRQSCRVRCRRTATLSSRCRSTGFPTSSPRPSSIADDVSDTPADDPRAVQVSGPDELNPAELNPGARLSHIDGSGAARMVDVGAKASTRRRAVAGGTFRTTAEVIDLLSASSLPKGDVLATARIAGIMAAKRTDSLIPLCHQLALSSVDVDFEVGATHIDVTATVATSGQTGVEMEALTAVAVAGLTLHDMVKAVDRRASMHDIRLLEKTGGKSGDWRR